MTTRSSPDSKPEPAAQLSCSPEGKGESVVQPNCSPDSKGECVVQPNCSPDSKGESVVQPNCSPDSKGESVVQPNCSPDSKGESVVQPNCSPDSKGESVVQPNCSPNSKGESVVQPNCSPDSNPEPAAPAAQPSSSMLMWVILLVALLLGWYKIQALRSARLNPAENASPPTQAPAFRDTAIVGLSHRLQTAVLSWLGCIIRPRVAVIVCCGLLFWNKAARHLLASIAMGLAAVAVARYMAATVGLHFSKLWAEATAVKLLLKGSVAALLTSAVVIVVALLAFFALGFLIQVRHPAAVLCQCMTVSPHTSVAIAQCVQDINGISRGGLRRIVMDGNLCPVNILLEAQSC